MILFVSFMVIEVRDNMMILSVDSMFKCVEMDFCFDFLWSVNIRIVGIVGFVMGYLIVLMNKNDLLLYLLGVRFILLLFIMLYFWQYLEY